MPRPCSPSLTRALALLLAALLLSASPVQAEKPDHAKHSKHNKGHGHKERSEHHDEHGRGEEGQSRERHFGSHHHQVVQDYYDTEFRSGNCPPGLAKKNNGCLPPGQARKWKVGARLPSDVRYYELPPEIILRLGPPPSGYRYVRVAGDILMIAVGTSMVMDAIMDLGR